MSRRKRNELRSCPACGEGQLQPRVDHTFVQYKGREEKLPLHLAVCSECGSELAGTSETRKNKRAMIEFRKRVDGLLSGSDIRNFRKKFGLKQATLAKLVGGGEVAFSRYENDDVAQSEPMDSILRLCISAPINLMVLANSKGVELEAETICKIHDNQKDAVKFIMPELKWIKASLDHSVAESVGAVSGQGRVIAKKRSEELSQGALLRKVTRIRAKRFS